MQDIQIWTCIGFFGFIVVALLVAQGNAATARTRALEAARGAYQEALAALKRAPTDPNLRQAALEAGRSYAGLSRASKGATIFDEIALKNDLDAATAGASAAAVAAAPSASVADRLRQLDGLKAQGLVTEDEYQARRAKILESM